MEIRLIGPPTIVEPDGEVGLRGRKTWAVLARILLSDSPVPRRLLAESLFGQTNDPMGALRWALGQIRAALRSPGAFLGDPVDPTLPPGVLLDVVDLGTTAAGPPPDGELLEGVSADWSPEFDSWLIVERLGVERRVLSALRSDALRALARNDPERGSRRALSMVERSPFDEAGHVLLIKSLVALGEQEAAEDRVTACEELFARELGVPPSDAVRSAARPSVAAPTPGVSPSATTRSLLEAGEAAIDAGAPDAGVQCLRQAVAASQSCGDRRLEARTQAALGSALVHAVRGFDDEGAVALSRAVELAHEASDPELAATAMMELAYVDVLAGRRDEAERNTTLADQLAGDRADLRAGATGIAALNLADWGRTDEAITMFRGSLAHGEAADQPRRIGWTLGIGARTLIDAGLEQEADDWIARSLGVVADERWVAFRPWVETLRHQRALASGRSPEEVIAALEQTFALSCQIADPCWEGVAAIGLGNSAARAGRLEEAYGWFTEARARCTRVTDTYVWVEGSALGTEAGAALEAGDAARAAAAANDLVAHAAKYTLGGLGAKARALLAEARSLS